MNWYMAARSSSRCRPITASPRNAIISLERRRKPMPEQENYAAIQVINEKDGRSEAEGTLAECVLPAKAGIQRG